jgi:hypothetical protein
LEIAYGNAIGGGAAEGAEFDGLDVERGAEGFEIVFGLGVKRWFVGGESYATVPVVWSLVIWILGLRYWITDFATLMGSTPDRR